MKNSARIERKRIANKRMLMADFRIEVQAGLPMDCLALAPQA
jgi:hypothetical protein